MENVKNIELAIVKRLVQAILAKGYDVTIFNGGDEAEIKYSKDEADILAVCRQADEDTIAFTDRDGKRIGWFYLVYGNGGYDLISDYTYNDATNEIVDPINKWVEDLEDHKVAI